VVAALLAAVTARASLAQESTDTVARAAQRIDARLAEVSAGAASGATKANDVAGAVDAFARDGDVLRVKTIMIFGERKRQWVAAYARYGTALSAWARAHGAADAAGARTAVDELRAAWKTMKEQYPAEALESFPRCGRVRCIPR
jgi:hypothetical protein